MGKVKINIKKFLKRTNKNRDRPEIAGMERPEILREIGERIKRRRKEMNMSQSALAFDSGLHRSQVRRIEAGTVNGTIESYLAICRALHIPLAELVKDLDPD